MFAELVFNRPLNRSFTYRIPEDVNCEKGMRVTAPFHGRTLTGFVIETHERTPEGFSAKDIRRVVDKEQVFTQQQIDLARWMSSLYFCSIGEALSLMIPGGRREVEIPALAVDDTVSAERIELSQHQSQALQEILCAEHDMYYLFGVTGSGKTEVFLQSAEQVIGAGKSVIYLVPEISLTHQLAAMVRKRFEDDVAILHSALSASQRLKEWKRILHDEVHLVIGARSAVFAPCRDLGMVIIDEEHENSYKAGSTPRYHARQIAVKRIRDAKGVLLMGSATPSLESWKLMKEGSIRRLDLPDRVSGGSMPEVDIVNISQVKGVLSPMLRESMKEVLDRGKQVVLFLNRRGFSYFFHCRSCGYEMTCEDCSVSMTYHKQRNKMICHYCGATAAPIRVCPDCGSLDVGYSGFGTELVEETVCAQFPFARIGRVDADTIKKKDQLQQTLADFREGSLDILLGTQMVAKGLNFPGVELVGIIMADSGLHLPDFRAQERTFSLILQVAGRAGRFSDEGRVVVQTYHPENSAVALAAAGDVESFYEMELQRREELGFPPSKRMVRLVFRSRDQRAAGMAAEQAAELLDQMLDAHTEIDVFLLGPAEPPIAKIAQNHRWHILLTSARFTDLHNLVRQFLLSYRQLSQVYMEIDIDPMNLL